MVQSAVDEESTNPPPAVHAKQTLDDKLVSILESERFPATQDQHLQTTAVPQESRAPDEVTAPKDNTDASEPDRPSPCPSRTTAGKSAPLLPTPPRPVAPAAEEPPVWAEFFRNIPCLRVFLPKQGTLRGEKSL